MIKLVKGDEPQVLAHNKAAWTAEFESGKDRRHYAHPEVRDALRQETHRKCAYCESHMEHVSPSHVEHIVPKSRRPELVCEWVNLTLACSVCNTNKRDYYDEECPLLNPYADHPEQHLFWVGPMVRAKTPDVGRVTVRRLDLNRSELLYKRAETIERALTIVELMETGNDAVKKALQIELDELLGESGEHSAAARAGVLQVSGS